MLGFGMLALYRDWIVSGKRYREVRRERDRLFQALLGVTQTGERVSNVAQRSTTMAERAFDALSRQKSETDDDDGQD